MEVAGINFSGISLFLLPAIVSSVVFGLIFWKNRTSLWNGILFLIWILTLGFLAIAIIYQIDNMALTFIFSAAVLLVLLPFFLFFAFGSIIMPIALFWNFLLVRKRENLSAANMLTLFLAIFIVAFQVAGWIFRRDFIPEIFNILFGYISILTVYFSLNFANFILSAILYRIVRPKLQQDFLIVLGSGLIDGEKVPPLLASRIDGAIKFFEKSTAKGFAPKIIFSGGQGHDEKISEAEAMARYALEKGVPESSILREDKSKTTLQNMKFSKKIIHDKNAKVVFFTNNFHVFRAGIFAKKAGLKAQGIGTKTALYFLPNAIIREFIAITVHYKKSHIFVIGSMTILYIFGWIVSYSHVIFSKN